MTDLTSISSPLPSNSLSQFLRSVELLEDRKPTHGSSDTNDRTILLVHFSIFIRRSSCIYGLGGQSLGQRPSWSFFFFILLSLSHSAPSDSLRSIIPPLNICHSDILFPMRRGLGMMACNHPEERESSSHTPSLSQETTSRRRPPAPAVYTEIDLGTYFYPSWDNTACHEHAGIAGVAFSPFFRLPCCDKTRLASWESLHQRASDLRVAKLK